MSHFDKFLKSDFFLTGFRPCPYLPDRRERKLFTNLSGRRAPEINDALAARGFRRSQNIAYRPACVGCQACVSTRVCATAFQPTRSQARTLKRNADLVRTIRDPWATDEHFELFSRYVAHRHADGGMAEMDVFDFAAMIEDTPVRTRMVEYRLPPEAPQGGETAAPGRLVAASLTDVLSDGLSLVYSFFDPSEDRRSLGAFIILDHIDLSRRVDVDYVYLGYWVEGSPKMDYKIRFQPAEILTDDGWRRWRAED